jgi:hypothetical protein
VPRSRKVWVQKGEDSDWWEELELRTEVLEVVKAVPASIVGRRPSGSGKVLTRG